MSRWTLEVRLPPYLRSLPADLTALLVTVVVTTAAVFLPVVSETPLRIVVGLPFVLFVPGYAFVAALFPEAGSSPEEGQDEAEDAPDGATDRGIDGIERVALAFGLSIAIVPLIGLGLNFTPWGIRLVPIVIALDAFTVISTVVAARRRWELPPEERFSVPYRRWVAAARNELLEPETNADLALNVLLVASVLLAVGSVGYAVAVPQQGESFTEFYLLTEDDDGELIADDYPTEFVAGEPQSLVVGIGNQEHQPVTYTVIVEIQRVEIVDNDTVVREAQQQRRFRTRVDANETWTRSHTVAPQLTGERLRLQYLLYREEPSTPLNRSAAYRELHLWVNVTAPGEESTARLNPAPVDQRFSPATPPETQVRRTAP
jgi:uncharacterized membrane protein